MIVVTVARRPLAGSVAANVLEHGTGAIDVDASRVAAAPGDETTSHVQGKDAANSRHTLHKAWQGIEESYQTAGQKLGRWPANLVLGHLDGCRQLGTRKVRGSQLDHVCSGEAPNGVFNSRPAAPKRGHTDGDGLEEVAAWACAPGCPVADLDAQSGDVPTQKSRSAPDKASDAAGMFGLAKAQKNGPEYLGEVGGASRFFKQVRG